MKYTGWILFVFFICLSINRSFAQPSPKYEFRAVWVATVINIDWPNKKGLSSDEQKAEFIRLLNMHQSNGMNAVIVQVRPAADAFFPSEYEPWSEYLSGTQGKPPYPYYDPLQFMIEETHKRGMEFHAWINPYRAVFDMNKSSVAANHITRTHPEWFIVYGGKKYFDPGRPEVMQYVNDIICDMLERYDMDGLHLDDYFYPYRIDGKEFNDITSYQRYGKGMNRDDWRRSNTDSIVKKIHETVLNTNPRVKFGISPFGVWRNQSKDPQGSATRGGQTCYDDLYADILLWLRKGWIDYVAPQLYWEIGHKLCDYETLLQWWADHGYNRQIFVGHGLYRAGSSAAWRNRDELPNEIKMLRDYETVQGSIYFSSKNFENNPNGWNDSLRTNYYRYPAIIPPMSWIDDTKPEKSTISPIESDKENSIIPAVRIQGKMDDPEAKKVVVYFAHTKEALGKQPRYILMVENDNKFSFAIPDDEMSEEGETCYVAVTTLSMNNNESDLSNIIKYKKSSKGWKVD